MYITTENWESEGNHRGRIGIKNAERSGHLLFGDIIVKNVNGKRIRLNRVDLGKLKELIKDAGDEA